MRRQFVTFPRGSAEGLIVLALDRDADGVFDIAAAIDAVTSETRPGVWGVWLDGVDWGDPQARGLIEAIGERVIIMQATLGELNRWPAANVEWVLDASAIVRTSGTDHALAIALGENIWLPKIADLIVVLESDQLPPSTNVFDMLEAAAKPRCCMCITPADYQYRQLLLGNLSRCTLPWAVRS